MLTVGEGDGCPALFRAPLLVQIQVTTELANEWQVTISAFTRYDTTMFNVRSKLTASQRRVPHVAKTEK